jgi:hypothetical protein
MKAVVGVARSSRVLRALRIPDAINVDVNLAASRAIIVVDVGRCGWAGHLPGMGMNDAPRCTKEQPADSGHGGFFVAA